MANYGGLSTPEITHCDGNINVSAYTYTHVYNQSSGAVTVVINGQSIAIGPYVTLPVGIIKTITGTLTNICLLCYACQCDDDFTPFSFLNGNLGVGQGQNLMS